MPAQSTQSHLQDSSVKEGAAWSDCRRAQLHSQVQWKTMAHHEPSAVQFLISFSGEQTGTTTTN